MRPSGGLLHSLGDPQAVPEAADGLDPVAGPAELRPEAAHVHVHRSGADPVGDLRLHVPRLLEELPAALGPTPPLYEREQEPELGGSERYLLAVERRLVGGHVEPERARPEDPPAADRA